ncbi:Ubiquinone/menaquinone biosynthesis C-methyltransferase UbiE [Fundidesulfovibrio magnetotacticus]|uniref:Ubiquinone/menaquinone biosynthesis C-methyltransferase UbiE n=1 Tax=Fundidesulfovibrio magnetotacticus TaxID=2730080 RepID=A0A6V8LQR2_9BACT|nr:class I SAM-dependent methyltransferase [Fundidesulfovibrio magnetotacticus]GFK94833.1 Ubiquinone/menaquinone biosynthesis C-methyltransferase UbiE [Fundidesulfovibrio magnetotacticus]
MIIEDISLLQCIHCNADLELEEHFTDEDESIVEGVSTCNQCHARYPIIKHVMILAPIESAKNLLQPDDFKTYLKYKSSASASSEEYHIDIIKSGSNWNQQFSKAFPITTNLVESDGFWGKEAFWNFCGLHPSLVSGKTVCVYCGGSGRESYHLLNSDARRVVVIDIGSHIFNIQKLCKQWNNKLILLMADFYQNPVRSSDIDISICDHALQHISNNRQAFSYMSSKTKDNGIISVCVYSHENNFIMTKIVEPFKRYTRRVPSKVLLSFSYLPAIILYALALTYQGLSKYFPEQLNNLPYYDLLTLWYRGGFEKFHEASFDLLHAPISYHFYRDELVNMANENNLELLTLSMVNRTMWSMVASKPPAN